jgi:hypothetical protein
MIKKRQSMFTRRHGWRGRVGCIAALLLGLSINACDEDSTAPPPAVAPTASPLIALTPTEYNNTIRDLLGMPNDGAAWPDAPAIAADLSQLPEEDQGLFGGAPVKRAPWPWTFPSEVGVDDFESMAAGQ